MINILLDTNVLLDICLNRMPFVDDALEIFKAIELKTIKGHVTATTITDIYFIASKQKEHELAIQFISALIDTVNVVGVNRRIISDAIRLDWSDFEDALQYTVGKKANVSTIVTRNPNDFTASDIPVFTPSQFVLQLPKN